MSIAVEPPSYNDSPAYTDTEFDVTPLELQSELPAYTGPTRLPVPRQTLIQEPKVFTFESPQKGKTSASLTLLGDSLLSKNTAVIVEGSSVEGTVNFNSEKGDEIQTIIITVKGELITGYLEGEQFNFFERSSTIWSQAMGDPRGSAATVTKFTGKLKGKYSWSYCIDMPREAIMVYMGVKNGAQPFHLPQTFLERHSRASVQYEVSVRFCRSKLKSDQMIQARFGYIPKIYPSSPFSALRQLAYQENVPLMGPDIDPLGWHSLETVSVRGKIFNNREVDIRCTLSLAKPLTYTRNSVIPLYLKLESEDLQALDLLSSPKAVVVKLQRCVRLDKQLYMSVDRLTWRDDFQYYHPAVWWPSSQSEGLGETPTIRCLQGELHLKADMKPSSSMAFFRVEYDIHLLPFDPVAFERINHGDAPLAIQRVQIATMFSPGTRPRSYTPPGYDTGPANSTDYANRALNWTAFL